MTDTQSKTAGSEVERISDLIKDGASNTRANAGKVDVWWEFDGDAIAAIATTLSHPATQAGALQAVSEDEIHLAWRGALKACGVSDGDRDVMTGVVRSMLPIAATQPNAAPAAEVAAYSDSTPHLHIGDSAFEDWYRNYLPNSVGHKQIARDAYSAGMGDPLVVAAPAAAIDAREQEDLLWSAYADGRDDEHEGLRAHVFDAFMNGLSWMEANRDEPMSEWAAAADSYADSICTDLASRSEAPAARPNAAGQEQGDAETLHCETCDGTGRVVETVDVDVPGHNRAGSYQATVRCPDCEGGK